MRLSLFLCLWFVVYPEVYFLYDMVYGVLRCRRSHFSSVPPCASLQRVETSPLSVVSARQLRMLKVGEVAGLLGWHFV